MRHALLLPLVAVALGACMTPARRPQFSAGYPVHDCPETLEGQVQLRAEVRPAHLPETQFRQPSIATAGSVARRLVVSIVPAGLSHDDRIVWSALSVKMEPPRPQVLSRRNSYRCVIRQRSTSSKRHCNSTSSCGSARRAKNGAVQHKRA